MASSTIPRPAPAAAVRALVARGAAAACLAVAAGAHLAALPAHRGEGLTAIGFFLAVAILQLAAATALTHGSSPTIRAAVVSGNLGVLALWMWSRTAGVPFGSHPGVAEAVGPLDLAAAAAEIIAVAAVAFLPRALSRASTLFGPTVALAVVAATVALGGARLVPVSSAHHSHGAAHRSVTAEARGPGDAAVGVNGPAAADAASDGAGVALDNAPASTEVDPARGGAADGHDAGHDHREPSPHP